MINFNIYCKEGRCWLPFKCPTYKGTLNKDGQASIYAIS